jgi:hypothetical protein
MVCRRHRRPHSAGARDRAASRRRHRHGSLHFLTKESLFAAVLLSRVELIVERAKSLMEADDPGAAFFDVFDGLVAEGTVSKGLAERWSVRVRPGDPLHR